MHRRLAAASRARARGPRAPAQGHAPVLEVRAQVLRVRPGRRRAPLETPGLRLLAGRTGRRHAARGLPEVRRRGRPGAVGGARLEVHACVSANWRPQYGHYFSAA